MANNISTVEFAQPVSQNTTKSPDRPVSVATKANTSPRSESQQREADLTEIRADIAKAKEVNKTRSKQFLNSNPSMEAISRGIPPPADFGRMIRREVTRASQAPHANRAEAIMDAQKQLKASSPYSKDIDSPERFDLILDHINTTIGGHGEISNQVNDRYEQIIRDVQREGGVIPQTPDEQLPYRIMAFKAVMQHILDDPSLIIDMYNKNINQQVARLQQRPNIKERFQKMFNASFEESVQAKLISPDEKAIILGIIRQQKPRTIETTDEEIEEMTTSDQPTSTAGSEQETKQAGIEKNYIGGNQRIESIVEAVNNSIFGDALTIDDLPVTLDTVDQYTLKQLVDEISSHLPVEAITNQISNLREQLSELTDQQHQPGFAPDVRTTRLWNNLSTLLTAYARAKIALSPSIQAQPVAA